MRKSINYNLSKVFLVNQIEKNIATIFLKDNNIHINFYKNNKFIEIVRELDYKWNGVSWIKELNKFTKSKEDAMAEVATRLVDNYINVSIQSSKAYKKFIDKTFKEECFKWIVTTENGSDLIFLLRNKAAIRLGMSIKKIQGIKYEKGFYRTTIANNDRVLEFAERNGFEITDGALKKIGKFNEAFAKKFMENN